VWLIRKTAMSMDNRQDLVKHIVAALPSGV
jgi:hypothetical protein